MTTKEIVKSVAGATKVGFSKSARKGGYTLDVYKMTASPETSEMVTKILEKLEENKITGWSAFSSRDGGTIGIKASVPMV